MRGCVRQVAQFLLGLLELVLGSLSEPTLFDQLPFRVSGRGLELLILFLLL
jgi:hypothetical protein